ncbi:MAG: 23S rRNA (uridine(2552)-2'-O)-methyltransferase RlmE [Gammaproteobacteria bacterium]
MARSKSSGRWLKEHFDDPYVKQAQREGYRSRAVYKLLEIQARDKILRPGITVVDLGAAPGSWTQIAVSATKPGGLVFALDILAMEPLSGADILLGDFREQAVLDELLKRLDGRRVDLVLSDMAPNISGVESVDQPRALYLAELALEFSRQVLVSGGAFLVKVFQGQGSEEYLKTLRSDFASLAIRKPKASRPRSNEVYALARNFKL